jgi:choline-sulfatase
VIRTPNIDRLAREGVLFDACYTPSPLCVPARLSFTAGKYISRIAAWNNTSMPSSEDIPSLPRVLNDAGYETILCGKMHYDKQRRYGFSRDAIPSTNSSTMLNLRQRRAPDDLESKSFNFQKRTSDFYVAEDSRIMRKDRRVTTTAIEIIRSRAAGDKPVFLLVGYTAPHFPLIIPPSFDNYKDKVPMPEIPPGLIDNLPLNYKHLRAGFGMEHQPPGLVKRGRELYWGFVEWMDNEVGKVLGALADSNIARDTLVIFTTDHGENKGDHGLWWKNNLYDHAARIPLIVWYPAKWRGAQRRHGACSLVDVVKTIADIAGANVPGDWDGDSLVPYIEDERYPWKDLALSEYYGHNIASGITMIRKGNWKYVYHNKVPGRQPDRELFNLKDDPKELHNLAGDASMAGLLGQLHAAMVAELACEPDDNERRYDETTVLATRAGVKNVRGILHVLGKALRKIGRGCAARRPPDEWD